MKHIFLINEKIKNNGLIDSYHSWICITNFIFNLIIEPETIVNRKVPKIFFNYVEQNFGYETKLAIPTKRL